MPDVALVRDFIGCVFVSVITESKIYRIYKAVLQTIKVVIHNLSETSNFIT
jgi:hypothetical protein